MHRLIITLVLLAAFPLFSQEWEEPTEERQKINASDGAAGDSFGSSIAAWGDFVVVGAPNNPPDIGAAYVFRHDRDRRKWLQQQRLRASDWVAADRLYFGGSVAISGEVVVIGAKRDDENGDNSGSAYVFRYDADEDDWLEEQKLTASDAAENDLFGVSVAVSSDVAVVGAHASDGSGSAYVFRYDSDEEEWIEEQKLTASDAATSDLFGIRTSISDNEVVLIGAIWDDDDGSLSGSVYVFRYDADEDEWIEEQKLTASDAASYDRFGITISVVGDVAIIGAQFNDEGMRNAGAAYVFRFDPDEAEWVEEQKLTASDRGEDDFFGNAVSHSGHMAVIGAFEYFNDTDSGAAYLFRYDPDEAEWVEEKKLVASDADEGQHFGQSVTVSGSFALFGAPLDDEDGADSGSAYGFILPRPFLRGDADGSGTVSALVDTLFLLEWAFADGNKPQCMDAADVNDDGKVSGLLDALALLQYEFSSAEEPPSPGPNECGLDPSEDEDVFCLDPPDECL